MKQLFIIILFILLQSFPSFGSSPNGKGIVCNCNLTCRGDFKDRGWFFNNDRVTLHYFVEKNTKIIIEQGKKNPVFRLTVNKISWEGYFLYELDRKSLIVKYDKIERTCFLHKTKKDYFTHLKNLKKIYQNEINKKIKDNKI